MSAQEIDNSTAFSNPITFEDQMSDATTVMKSQL